MTTQLKLTLLGGVAFAVDGVQRTALPTRTEQALVIYLTYQQRAIPRDVLIDLFYPDSDAEQGRRNLRTALTRIKAKIGDVLAVDRSAVGVREDIDLQIDTVWFEQALQSEDGSTSAETLQPILDRYHGDFLAGFFLRNAPEFELWQVGMRERLRLLAVGGFERLIKLLSDSAEFTQALIYTNKLLTIEPLMEHVHRSKMLLLARVGQPAQALGHLKVTHRLFADELGIELSQPTVALRDRIANLDVPPPLVVQPARSQFVGRQDELAQIVSLLKQPTQRFITLFGPGGMGKTRLGAEVARMLHAKHTGLFLDGIFFVELAGVDSAETLALQIALALGITLVGQNPQAQLVKSVQARELLLVLDNFEQLIAEPDAVALLDQLLQQGPSLKLLVTSREQLRLYEETVFDVRGLATPAEAQQDIMQVASVALFMQQAKRRSRSYTLAQTDVAAVGELCRLLDGGPLGVELAAGWAQSHSVTQILTNIQQSFDFLATRFRNVPPRQRSLRAVFDYSWGLLSSDEQQALTLLSLFSGPFTLPAALAVAQTDAQIVTSLAEKALLQDLGEGRFRLHPQVGGFSAEILPPDQADAAMARFATHYVGFIDNFNMEEDHWPTFRKRAGQIGFELANVQKAWRWVLAQALGETADAAQWVTVLDKMRRPLRAVYLPLNRSYDGYLLFRDALQSMTDAGWANASKQKRFLHAAIAMFQADQGTLMGEFEAAVATVEPLVPLFEEAEAYVDLFTAYNILLDCYQRLQLFADADALTPRYEVVLKHLNRPFLFGFWDLQLATKAQAKGEYDRAIALYQSALKNIEPTENARYLAVIYDYMGELYAVQGQPARAVELKEIALGHARAGETLVSEAIILTTLADAYSLTGQLAQAHEAIALSSKLLHQLKMWGSLPQTDIVLGDLHMRDEAWQEAVTAYRAALERAAQFNLQGKQMMVYTRLPWLLWHMGKQADAATIAAHIAAISEPDEHALSAFWVKALPLFGEAVTSGSERQAEFDEIVGRFVG